MQSESDAFAVLWFSLQFIYWFEYKDGVFMSFKNGEYVPFCDEYLDLFEVFLLREMRDQLNEEVSSLKRLV